MACLAHNQTFRVCGDERDGLYRVVLSDPVREKTVVVRIDDGWNRISENSDATTYRKNGTSKIPQRLCGQLLSWDNATIDQLRYDEMLQLIDIERANFNDSAASKKHFERRKKVMANFLLLDRLRSTILKHMSIAQLVNEAVAEHGVSRPYVYKCWTLLCQLGFSEQSLRPRLDRCGAPGAKRDCGINGRLKPGRKSNLQRIHAKTGVPILAGQPGMTAQWRQLILYADRKIPSPKPKFSRRRALILNFGFVKHLEEANGELTPIPLQQGEYPNDRQIRRILQVEIPELQRIQESTTKGHFDRSMRGLRGRSWKGVPGPGHTYAIDSTIADIYLRSSVNRAWIIGRPIVYIIVDVWSTAIVGFYVCLRGPSWEMAKVSLFSATASPGLLGELWQFTAWPTLYPQPTLPAALMCDRGEYLSMAAKETALRLIPRVSFAPPYRPDLKGLVEVLHRINKDHQYWIPGAIDARRKEFELRKFDPTKAIFTVKEYAEYLHTLFSVYNLTADRSKRLDPHMIAAGVVSTPAGLWRWGHEFGVGTLRHFPQSQLIMDLLPTRPAKVTPMGVHFEKLHYVADQSIATAMSAQARNFGSWEIPSYHFPGSVSRIWTPNPGKEGILELKLMEQARASSAQTFEEVEDAFTYASLNIEQTTHQRVLLQMDAHHRTANMVTRAAELTHEAVMGSDGYVPPLTEARQIEAKMVEDVTCNPSPLCPPAAASEDAAFFAAMQAVLKSKVR